MDNHLRTARLFELTEASVSEISSSITEFEKLHISQCDECRDVLQAARRPFWRRIVLKSELDRNSSDVDADRRRRLPLLRDTILRCHP
jgi:hypothetical protein